MKFVKAAKFLLINADKIIQNAIQKLEEFESRESGEGGEGVKPSEGKSEVASDSSENLIGTPPNSELLNPYYAAEILWRYGAFLLLENAPRSQVDGLWQARKFLLEDPHRWPEIAEHLDSLEIHEKALRTLDSLARGVIPEEYLQLEKKWGTQGAELLKVRGIGPHLARNIRETLNISTLEELEQSIRDNSLLRVKGIGPKLLQQIQAELREAEKREAELREKLHQFEQMLKTSPPRSFRDYRKLLREDLQPSNFSESDEFLDLLPLDWSPPSPVQRLMEFPLYSKFYEELFRPYLTRIVTHRPVEEEIRLNIQLLNLKPDAVVLDAACGTGNYTRAIAQSLDPARGGIVIGLDPSRPMLVRAIEKQREFNIPNIKFIRGDVHRLPFRNNSFDAVHCAGAFHLFQSPLPALREFSRVLKEGGTLVISTFILSENPFIQSIQKITAPLSGFHWFELGQLTSLISDCDFRILQVIRDGLAVSIAAEKK